MNRMLWYINFSTTNKIGSTIFVNLNSSSFQVARTEFLVNLVYFSTMDKISEVQLLKFSTLSLVRLIELIIYDTFNQINNLWLFCKFSTLNVAKFNKISNLVSTNSTSYKFSVSSLAQSIELALTRIIFINFTIFTNLTFDLIVTN